MSREPFTFFLAGTMQGSRAGGAEVDQGYRVLLREAICVAYPEARIVCPRELLYQGLADDHEAIRRDHGALAEQESIRTAELSFPLQRLRHAFCELADLAGCLDVLVAWLPGQEASMGTAAEMWSAKKGGATVIAITTMRQNLAVLSMSDAIVPSIEAFSALLASPWLDEARSRSEGNRFPRTRGTSEELLAASTIGRPRRTQSDVN